MHLELCELRVEDLHELADIQIIMHKTGPFTKSGVSKFVKFKLVVVYTKHQHSNCADRFATYAP